MSVIRGGISRKRSPLARKNWISCLMTLDGRDKFTKVVQYSSRLLAWYLAGLASASTASSLTATSLAETSVANLRGKLLLALSERFRSLYKSLVDSRKAFRLGRSFIEIDKLSNVGWGNYLLEHCGGADRRQQRELERRQESGGGGGCSSTRDNEEEEDDECEKSPLAQQQLHATPPLSKTMPTWKLVGSSLKLLGLMGFWACDNVSFLTGTGFLDPLMVGGNSGANGSSGGSGNGSGSGGSRSGSDSNGSIAAPAKSRAQRKARISEWAARSYFLAVMAGLYVSVKEVIRHRAGPLAEVRRGVMLRSSKMSVTKGGAEAEAARILQQQQQQRVESDHFIHLLALLKSICDIIVFSNNPGVDLHMKFRGKKNNEAVHCVAGLISASTVLYNAFPDDNVKDGV